jgi:hypothetical protein
VGHTTSTFYPAAGSAGATVDGYVFHSYGAGDELWATLVAAAGNGHSDDGATGASILTWDSVSTANEYTRIHRGIVTFPTSTIGTDTISSAVLTLFGYSKADQNGVLPNIDIYKTLTLANAGAGPLADTDYAQIGTTSQTGSPITYANWKVAADAPNNNNDFTFNATGIGNINKTGISGFGIRNANYDAANTPPSWYGSNRGCEFRNYYADEDGTTSDPKLVVVHEAEVTPTVVPPQNLIIFE